MKNQFIHPNTELVTVEVMPGVRVLTRKGDGASVVKKIVCSKQRRAALLRARGVLVEPITERK